MSLLSLFRRSTAAIAIAAAIAALPAVAFADPDATIDAVSPGTFVTTVANATVPITLTRVGATPVLGFSVTLQLSGLTTTSGAISEGGFLSASGGTTSFQVVDNGGGSYTVDGVTLGTPCGSSATSGTLFSLAVGSALTSGTGTVTLTSVTLRDCSNNPLGASIGTTATVSIDRSPPSVAVTSPNGGESWVAGSSHPITWTATDAEGIAADGITLEYSLDDGSSWLPVASGLANSGTFPWTVPAGPNTTTLVRATAVDVQGNTASDASDAVFTIQGTSSTSLASAPNPSTFGASVTFTATVAPSGATGSVEFFDGATSLGTSPVSAASAVLNTSALAVGVHSLTAHYSGDAGYSASTSSAYSLEVKAKIVATAGANGSIAPSGTTLYSLNATPSYTFAADPGYHVASVTVDGGAAPLTSPYTFAALSSNHTLDVQFAVNPAVPAITTLTATQLQTGNDSSGDTKITLSWTAVPAGSTVEVWRKGFGNYPEYDNGPTPGSVPAPPASYPPAGWTLSPVTSPGGTDEPGTRDFWYYVAYVTDTFGTRSPVSNQTTGTLDYHLGDVSNGTTPGLGDNKVTTSDLSVLGAHYGISGAAVDAVDYLDVGPTTDLSANARPMTDHKINFEDLVMFAINYYPVVSAPQAHAAPAASSQDALALAAPSAVHAGEDVAVRISFTGTGRVLAMSARLAWDPAVVQPVSFTAGDAVLEQGALLFSAAPGSVDGAVFTGARYGFTGAGEFATLHFHVVAAGDPRFGFAGTDARDSQNHTIALATAVTAVTPKSFVTAFAPAMPNPFGRSTMFAFSLARAGRADLEVYSVDGRRVRTITSGPRDAGEYRLEWDGEDDSGRPIAPGVYYARLVTAQGRFTRVVTRLE